MNYECHLECFLHCHQILEPHHVPGHLLVLSFVGFVLYQFCPLVVLSFAGFVLCWFCLLSVTDIAGIVFVSSKIIRLVFSLFQVLLD